MGPTDSLEVEDLRKARVDAAPHHQLVERGGLFVVGEMGALQALLARPQVPEVDDGVVSGGPGADDDHPAGVADEDRGRDGLLPRVVEHDARVPLLTHGVPHGFPEGLGAFGPPAIALGVAPVGRHSPVREVPTIDRADSTQLQAELSPVLRRDHGHGLPSEFADDLDGHGAEPSGASPDQDDVSLLDHVGRPSKEHAVGGGPDQCRRGGLLPREVGRLGQTLVGLNLGELSERAPVRLIAVNAEGRGEPRIAATHDHGIIRVPLPAVDHHMIADSDVGDAVADGPHHPGGVAPADVEVVRLSQPGMHSGDVQRHALGRPHVVVVDARRHHQDQHFPWARRRRVDHLRPEGRFRLAEPLGADDLRVHPAGNLTPWRDLPDLVQLFGHRGTIGRAPRR